MSSHILLDLQLSHDDIKLLLAVVVIFISPLNFDINKILENSGIPSSRGPKALIHPVGWLVGNQGTPLEAMGTPEIPRGCPRGPRERP